MEKVTIVGGGLVGSLLAILLAKNGIGVDVFEKRSDPRNIVTDKGRSINLALSDRGWKALQMADPKLAEEVRKNAIPMIGRVIHDQSGATSLQRYGNEGQNIYSISRAVLNDVLIGFGEKMANINYNFNQKCIDLDLSSDELLFENTIDKTISSVKTEFVFGADGAYSPIRYSLQRTDGFNYSQEYLEYGYKELNIPPGKIGKHLLEKNALHIWPRKSFMLIALPNTDGSFTCTLFLPFYGSASFDGLKSDKSINDFFDLHFKDAKNLIPDFVEQFKNNPTSSLVTVRCFPWVHKNKYALIGDAAHAIVPFYGQGMNAGFEDCFALNNLIQENIGNWISVLQKFQTIRKGNTDAIAELALRNFVEMRDLVIDKEFLLRKKIEAKLHQLFPDQWIPLYTMVTFTDMDYSEALKLAKLQDSLMEEVMDISGIEASWENIDFEAIIKKYRTAQKRS